MDQQTLVMVEVVPVAAMFTLVLGVLVAPVVLAWLLLRMRRLTITSSP
jgi:hypothetical protein